MNWFRKHLKHGSRLALFALAIQFALSFGHFHSLAAQAAPAIKTHVNFATTAGLAAQAADAVAQKQQPSTPDTDQQPADNCAICAVMSLAGNVLFATPPLLQLPQAVEFLYLTTDAEFVHLNAVYPAFQSRAPPAS
jgi:hypothetical protein